MSKIADINPYAEASIPDRASAKKLGDAASEFEAIFIYQMLKTMRETITKSSLAGDGKGEEIYTSMLDHELSIEMAKAGGIGLKQMLLRDFGAYADKQGAPEKPMHTVVPVINQKPVAPAEAVPIRLQESPNVNIQNDIRKKEFMPIKPEPQFLSPIEKSRISSGYGMRHDPQTSERRFHHGIDIASPEGTPVHPSMDGTVIFSGRKDGYGNTVEIRHDNGYITRYAHTKENLVDVGQRVTTNDMIAKVGNTGRSTGPHLHFEVRLEGYALNPLDMVSFS